MENSTLNDALLKMGLGNECLVQHERFYRSDDPPIYVVCQSNQIVEPKNNHSNDNTIFPFKMDNPLGLTFTKNEYFELQKANSEQLINYYQKSLAQLDLIAKENEAAYNKADMYTRRKHFFYCYLTSILNSPLNISFKNVDQIIALKKLFMNQKFKSKLKKNYVEKCCKEQHCPQLAICGSSYCGWHILKDPNQSLYEKCPVCGWPRIIKNFLPCQTHKGKPKPQRQATPTET